MAIPSTGEWIVAMRVVIDKARITRLVHRIRLMRHAARMSTKESFTKITEDIKATSQQMVPYKTGALHDSAYTRVDTRSYDVVAEVGYDRNDNLGYAWTRHQIPAREYTTPGTSHQYLLAAFFQHEDEVKKSVLKHFGENLRLIGFRKHSTPFAGVL